MKHRKSGTQIASASTSFGSLICTNEEILEHTGTRRVTEQFRDSDAGCLEKRVGTVGMLGK